MHIDERGVEIVMPDEPLPGPERYGHFEFMGHDTRVCRYFEVERFGTKMLRIDEPVFDEAGQLLYWKTETRNGTSIYRHYDVSSGYVIKAHAPYQAPLRPQLTINRDAFFDDDRDSDQDPFDEDGDPDDGPSLPPAEPAHTDQMLAEMLKSVAGGADAQTAVKQAVEQPELDDRINF